MYRYTDVDGGCSVTSECDARCRLIAAQAECYDKRYTLHIKGRLAGVIGKDSIDIIAMGCDITVIKLDVSAYSSMSIFVGSMTCRDVRLQGNVILKTSCSCNGALDTAG